MATAELIDALPHARRYARALVGTQAAGDALVAQALADRPRDLPTRLGLYAGITSLVAAANASAEEEPGPLTLIGRQLLLLTTLEELSIEDAARIVGIDSATAGEHLREARAVLRVAAAATVLIIEDEPVIALDLQLLVEGCGHRVVGVAASEHEAERLALETGAKLILADVNLGRGGNGIAAVRRILETISIPVIFVTAYPERLLTAEGMEPAFVVRKPFDPVSLAVATYQAINAGRVPLA